MLKASGTLFPWDPDGQLPRLFDIVPQSDHHLAEAAENLQAAALAMNERADDEAPRASAAAAMDLLDSLDPTHDHAQLIALAFALGRHFPHDSPFD